MITLMASIAGFISSIIPEFIKIIKDKNDKQHELQILDRQIQYSKQKHHARIEEINLNHEIVNQATLYSTYNSGISWIDGLNALVRPILAYSFFGIYSGFKIAQYKALCNYVPLINSFELIWSLEDQAIFAGIISFYFGQRTFNKFSKK